MWRKNCYDQWNCWICWYQSPLHWVFHMTPNWELARYPPNAYIRQNWIPTQYLYWIKISKKFNLCLQIFNMKRELTMNIKLNWCSSLNPLKANIFLLWKWFIMKSQHQSWCKTQIWICCESLQAKGLFWSFVDSTQLIESKVKWLTT